jgi:hypothetical protein
MTVDYELAWSIATDVANRIEARFPKVRVTLRGPSEVCHGVDVNFSPLDVHAVNAEVTVFYDGSYNLEAGSDLVFESDDMSDKLDGVADEIVEQIEAFGEGGLVSVRHFKFLGPLSPNSFGSPGIDVEIDEILRSRFSVVLQYWESWV